MRLKKVCCSENRRDSKGMMFLLHIEQTHPILYCSMFYPALAAGSVSYILYLDRASCSVPNPGSAAHRCHAIPALTSGGPLAPAWLCPWAALHACQHKTRHVSSMDHWRVHQLWRHRIHYTSRVKELSQSKTDFSSSDRDWIQTQCV